MTNGCPTRICAPRSACGCPINARHGTLGGCAEGGLLLAPVWALLALSGPHCACLCLRLHSLSPTS
eukprot:3096049-Rhodomonas_salina.4